LQRYVQGYRKHLEFESRDVFLRAKGRLGRRELHKSSARPRHIDDPIFGGGIRKRYRRLARHLGLGWNGCM
jgi:hemerythrin-like domain-containing protein